MFALIAHDTPDYSPLTSMGQILMTHREELSVQSYRAQVVDQHPHLSVVEFRNTGPRLVPTRILTRHLQGNVRLRQTESGPTVLIDAFRQIHRLDRATGTLLLEDQWESVCIPCDGTDTDLQNRLQRLVDGLLLPNQLLTKVRILLADDPLLMALSPDYVALTPALYEAVTGRTVPVDGEPAF